MSSLVGYTQNDPQEMKKIKWISIVKITINSRLTPVSSDLIVILISCLIIH